MVLLAGNTAIKKVGPEKRQRMISSDVAISQKTSELTGDTSPRSCAGSYVNRI